MRIPSRLAGSMVVAALVLAGCAGGDGGPQLTAEACPQGEPTAPAGPDPLPVATLGVLGEDRAISTACWVGQPLLVNFWADWCAECRDEMPALEEVHQEVGDQLRFIGVDYKDNAQRAIAFAEEVGVTYELVEDPEGTYFDALEARGAPTTVLVDAEGRVVYRHFGGISERRLRDLIRSELGIDAG